MEGNPGARGALGTEWKAESGKVADAGTRRAVGNEPVMRVSVVMPVLNGEAYLAPTLRSVLNQTQPPAEIIVVDDGSTDRSLDIARSFGSPVRAVPGPFGSAAAARQAGAAQASGEALMFLDADD